VISTPGPLELLVIAVIALIVLGPKRLPEAARSVGKGMREMRDAFQGNELRDDPYVEDDHELEEERPAAKPVP
jgi:sec-independent protein translocase protein TatA